MRKGFWKKGFTLMEVIVVLVILTILLAIGIPAAINYMKLAEFRRNESHAKTAYLAAESVLTWYRASGEWEEFCREVVHNGICNDTFEEDDERSGRIYTVFLDRAERDVDSSDLVRTLLSQSALLQEFSDSAVAIEIDIETGQVYSAFYGTRCEGLSYHPQEENSALVDISAAGDSRSYENRREYLLGYYSAEDVTNVVDLKPTRLKITTINLVNSETLTLNWSSNSRHDNLDVTFHIAFYQENGDSTEQELFSADINLSDLIGSGYGESNPMAGLKLTTADNLDAGLWYFPMTYDRERGRFSLVLDAMMSAKLMERLEKASAETGDEAEQSLIRSYSTSITRLGHSVSGSPAPALSLLEPQDIYAVISVFPTYENLDGDSREYRAGSPVQSNTENTLFAGAEKKGGGTAEISAQINRYRHLSNIRYCGEWNQASYTLTGRNMDWLASGTGIYCDTQISTPEGSRKVLLWQEAAGGLDFPSIGKLPAGQTLSGGPDTLLSNLQLGADSMPDDAAVEEIYTASHSGKYTRYLGLFGEIEGAVRDLTLLNPVLRLVGEAPDGSEEAASRWKHLWGVGILCGRSEGSLENITVRSGAGGRSASVRVWLAEREKAEESAPLGAGGLVGILAKAEADGTLGSLDDPARMKAVNLTMAGTVNGILPAPALSESAESRSAGEMARDVQALFYGTGGIIGCGQVSGVSITNCKNTAAVTGNLLTGGIIGRLTGDYAGDAGQAPASGSSISSIRECHNEGLVLCSTPHSETTWEGRYFGGILGFGEQVWIQMSSSASGRASSYRYTEAQREQVLLGQYVGGILGYGVSSQLTGCSTRRDGYVLGSDYVGGIAGGLSNNIAQVIRGEESGVTVTVNACYVIGNRYVGGIVGKNGDGSEESVIEDCVNNGVAAGYDRFIGGIVGYNGDKGTVKDCASYLSDYDNSVFQMITETWNTAGDCVGGLAGYNSGQILFEENAQVTVKSVSSIVVGRNFAGGIIGFNDAAGTLRVGYTLIGGRIYGYGDGIGGCIGLNAAEDVLKQELTIRPTSVTGRYCVGGAIGANVVDLSTDLTMDGFHVDNRLGSMEGTAFTGGVIGYQRTYTAEQLNEEAQKAGISGEEAGGSLLLACLLAGREESGGSAGGEGQEEAAWLPRIGDDCLPTEVLPSKNENTLILSRKNGMAENNNISIRSCIYTGGIIGVSEKESRLILRNCKNTGNLSLISGEDLSGGVSLKAYLEYAGIVLTDEQKSQIPDILVHMSGGVISANLEKHVIDSCVNTGNMSGFVGLGGIVSFNSGGVFNCVLEGNFGSAALDCIGGIAGLNGCVKTGEFFSYQDINNRIWQYTSGTIAGCLTQAGRTVSGRHYVGGIAGLNLEGALLTDSGNQAGISAAGNYTGGIAGANAGTIRVAADTGAGRRVIQSASGYGVGGIAGWNQTGGLVEAVLSGQNDLVVVNDKVRILADQKAGGILGINEGSLLSRDGGGYLVCEAEEIRTRSGYAGGIVGEAKGGEIRLVKNKSTLVTADRGEAGGIVAVNQSGMTLKNCINSGDVNSDSGYAGGIAAENYGTITDCRVEDADRTLIIQSCQKDAVGAVCAVNYENAKIENSAPMGSVRLSGQAQTAGGITGRNEGLITGGSAGQVNLTMPAVALQANNGALSVGGAAGTNAGVIENITVNGFRLLDFYDNRYLGGIAGRNLEGALVQNCTFAGGTMTERKGSGAAGNCYGGIAGENSGALENCTVKEITIEADGVYTATSTSTAKQKEALSSHIGGVAGKNEESGRITGCLIDGNTTSSIVIDNGMAGGIAGYNKGVITLSGDSSVKTLMQGRDGRERADSVQELAENAERAGIRGDANFVDWPADNYSLENFYYNNTKNKVTDGRSLQLVMTTNGNLGGITAYNAPSGRVDYCATGNWYLNNRSDAIGVGTGGIIGMNESEHDLSFLLNRAFVGRQLTSNNTNRFAGGIIGNQNNTTRSRWTIRNCVNYGTVYCLRTHYSGGILGQWTGSGGTIENCRNYGNLQTTYEAGWVGAAGGIVAQLYHAYEGHEYNLIGCGNYGNIYGRTGQSTANCANDSAGILGNITAYGTDVAGQGQKFTIQVLDCVNGSGVEIYSASMASGIVGFFSCDGPTVEKIKNATGRIELRIERCRNFAKVLKGKSFAAGIFGDRYGTEGGANTTLADCFSLDQEAQYYAPSGYPLISLNTGNSSPQGEMATGRNYYLWGFGNGNVDSFRVNTGNQVTIPDPTGNVSRAGAKVAYYLSIQGKQYFVTLNPGQKFSKNNLKIEGNTVIYTSGKNTYSVGEVLFEINENTDYNSIGAVTGSGSRYDTHVRTAWYRRELGSGWDAAVKKMPAPRSVSLSRDGSSVKIGVEPSGGSDPFCYSGTLYLLTDDGERQEILSDIVFYSENYQVELAPEYAMAKGKLVMEVCAGSMYEDVSWSEPVSSDQIPLDLAALPNPQIRMELNRIENGTGGTAYSYRFHLTNPEDYRDFNNYEISIKFMSPGSSNQTELKLVLDAQGNVLDNQWQMKSDSLQQLLVQACPLDGNSLPSSEVSVPVYLPASTPLIVLGKQNGNGVAVPGGYAEGTNLQDLRVTVTLDASASGIVTTPPVYRAELIGTWEENGETITAVLAAADMLTASNGSSKAVFTGLAEYISRAAEIRVRIWYAESGLGPVYTWHSLPGADGANLYTLVNAEDGGANAQWEYGYSTLLDVMDAADPLHNCRWSSDPLFYWLPRPNLAAVGSSLTPQFDADSRLQYVFSWDQDPGEYQPGQTYLVSLTGIRGGDRVTILSGVEVSDNTYTADAENWTYEQVELTVTRKGDAAGGSVGLSSTGTYQAGQRLPRPSQPSAVNPDVNELYYAVEWLPVVPEDGCASYEITLQPYAEDGVTLEAPQKLGEIPAGKVQENGMYNTVLNLEPYAGKRALLYITAKADAADLRYVDSVAGISCELAIPSRIGTPHVTWGKSWNYDRTSPVPAADFEQSGSVPGGTAAGGLTVKIVPQADSIPPGDSSYLVKAYVFDTEENAAKAREALAGNAADWNEEGLLAVYPSRREDGVVLPAVMDMNTGDQYSHTLQGLSARYAGKWILFYVRISSGNGQVSSGWSANGEIWQLPFVKLPPPAVSVTSGVRSVTASVQTNPDLPASEETWTANHTILDWTSAELADAAYVTLTKKNTDGTDKTAYAYRILETEEETDTGSVRHAVVERYQEESSGAGDTAGSWQEVGRASWILDENETWLLQKPEGTDPGGSQTAVLELSDYSFPVSGSYTEAELVTLYTIEPKAVLEMVCEDGGFGYTLILPDADSLVPKEGITISDANLRVTESVEIQADCRENLPDGSSYSSAYVRSDAYTAVFGN